ACPSSGTPPAMSSPWPRCLERLQSELPIEDFHTWVKPLQADLREDALALFAPNAFVVDTVRERFLPRIVELARHFAGRDLPVRLEVGALPRAAAPPVASPVMPAAAPRSAPPPPSNLDPHYSFDNFVEGKSN